MWLFSVEVQGLLSLNVYELERVKTDTDRGLTKRPKPDFVRKGCWNG